MNPTSGWRVMAERSLAWVAGTFGYSSPGCGVFLTWAGLGALTAIGVVLVFPKMCFIIESQHEQYATHAAAVEDGAFERGWLPGFIPADAREIRETHFMDDDRMWGSFRVSPGSDDWVRDLAPGLGRGFVRIGSPPRGNWWPEPLVGRLTESSFKAAGFDGYHADEPTYFGPRVVYLFLNTKSGHAYFFRE